MKRFYHPNGGVINQEATFYWPVIHGDHRGSEVPPPPIAVKYYVSGDLYNFAARRRWGPKRPCHERGRLGCG